MENKNEKEEQKKTETTSVGSFLDYSLLDIDIVDNNVVSFLKDKLNIASDVAVELASQLPKTIVDQIEGFDGEGISSIVTSISEAIKSLDFPDIDF